MALAPPLPATHLQNCESPCSFTNYYRNNRPCTKSNTAITAASTGVNCVSLTGSLPSQEKHGNSQANNRPSTVCEDIITPCRQGRLMEALGILYLTDPQLITADSNVYGSLLQVCIEKKALTERKQVHTHMVLNGVKLNVVSRIKLVTMYAVCGSVIDAGQVFDKMPNPNVFLWTAMISGYVRNGLFQEAVTLYCQMQWAGIQSDNFTFSCVLKSCAALSALQLGREIHGHIIRSGVESGVVVDNALVVMYSHCDIIRSGVESDVVVDNALVVMYSHYGRIELARQMFDKMSERNVVSWNSLIAGYAQNGHAIEALQLFRRMQSSYTKPNWITVTTVLPACSHLGALQQGKEIHSHIIKSEFEPDVLVGNALIDMYAKCGSIEVAGRVFDRMPRRDLVSWNAMIAGYGINGYGEDAFAHFYQMQQAGLKPDQITFISVLSACSHAGLVDEGWQYFDCMSREYQMTPGVEHYACMVDLLGRSGRLDEAEKFIQKMPWKPSSSVWGSLLAACRIHCKIELGERVAERLFQIEPENAGNYLLLSNIYAAAGQCKDVEKVRAMMKDMGVKKRPGCSWIEVKNRVHAFIAGDQSPPQSEEIYAMLESLAEQMENLGYVSATDFVLHDVGEEEKKTFLCGHSERLAIAFGLINTGSGTPLRITKTLRVCGDCHTATKFISKVVGREITVRDTNRFHHFKEEACSCGDYW